MDLPKIEEKTLYPPIINYLNQIGISNVIGESSVGGKHPDIYFHFNDLSFVIEVKIGKPEIGIKAISQAYDYARRLETQNIIILIYPEDYRNQVILDSSVVDEIALNKEIKAIILTEVWTQSISIKPIDLFGILKSNIILKEHKIDFRTIVTLIETYVSDLNSVVYQIKEEELITEVVNKLDLFSSIGDIKDIEAARKQIINLASYLLFNQLLFYHIYKKKSNNPSLKELDKIEKLQDIQNYFDYITDNIDYKSIYKVNILGHIPNKKVVVNILNSLIKAIKLLRAEHITHDLAGRFFHDLIPFEVRKVLAAFYTNPVAGDILANLTIDRWDEHVIDPACGSGTLLVSSYKTKQKLYQDLFGFANSKNIHKQFIEEELTGIDIMPFAAHISAINLTTQNIEQETNIVRIGTKDSLELASSLKGVKFKDKNKGIAINPYTEEIQLTLFGISSQDMQKNGSVSANGKGIDFKLNPFDVVIMNPPFSDREKMPYEMREKIKNNKTLGKICGHQVNLWGYFLVLSDYLLKENGKVGAVIPINIARGKATDKIRKYLLDNYYIKYIVKPISDVAFSEGASFRDILLIAEKRKPTKKDKTQLVFLKKSIHNMTNEDINNIVKELRNNSSIEDKFNDNFESTFIDYPELLSLNNNLMPLLGMFSINSIEVLDEFYTLLGQKSNEKIIELSHIEINEGFHVSPKGLSELTFITRPMTKDRIKRAFLILINERKDKISFEIKNANIKFIVENKKVVPALRTITGIDRLDITEECDYFIKDNFDGFEKILTISKFSHQKLDWNSVNKELKNKETYLALARRFRPDSDNTHFFAFYNEEKFVSPHTFKILRTDKKESKYQCLFLNSIIGISDIIRYREQTTEGFTDIMEADLNLFKSFNMKKLSKEDLDKLDLLFHEINKVEFPSILKQLETNFWARVKLDKTILNILGFSDNDVNEWIPKLYEVLITELKATK